MKRLVVFLCCVALSESVPALAQTKQPYSIAFSVRDLPSVFASMAHGGPQWVITTFLYDTLVWKDAHGVVPLLAREWRSSPDCKTWTFTLRGGVRWHDGEALTADDVLFTFGYLREHPLPSWASDFLRQVKSVRVTAPDTVEITLALSLPDFLNTVAGVAPILPRHVWQSIQDPVKYVERQAFIGSGPYKYVETRRGEYHLFAANTSYFLGRPSADPLIIKAVSNPALALSSGDVDAAALSSPLATARFRGKEDFAIVGGPYSYYLTKVLFNVTRPPFQTKEVRHAVAYAIDRGEIVRQALEGNGIVSSAGLLHPDSEWFAKDLPQYTYDPRRAAQLLDGAGYSRKDADGVRLSPAGKRLAFTFYQRSESPEMARQAEIIRNHLAAAGIQLDVKPMSTGPLENLLARGDFDIAYDSHGGTISLSTPATNPDFPAHTYRNDALTGLFAEFTTEVDPNRRRVLAARIQHIVAADLPAFPIANPGTILVYRKSKGVRWFWTKDGLGGGAPIWWNKLALLKTAADANAPAEQRVGAGTVTVLASCSAVLALGVFLLRRRKCGALRRL